MKVCQIAKLGKAFRKNQNELDTSFPATKLCPGHTFLYSRILWVAVVIGAVIFFSIQVKDRITAYLKHDSIVNYEARYTEKLEYPTVTICNQNT